MSDTGNFNSSVPQNTNSLAPLPEVNSYRSLLESEEEGAISKGFIPTGPALTQYDKKATFKNSAIMNPKRYVHHIIL